MTKKQDIWGWLIVAVAALAVGGVTFVVVKSSPRWLAARFAKQAPSLDIASLLEIKPELLQYRLTRSFAVPLRAARGLAVAADGKVLVAGDQAIHIVSAQGDPLAILPVKGSPSALAVAGDDHEFPGRLYVGVEGRVDVFAPGGVLAGSWQELGRGLVITSIAVAARDVFLADAGNRVIWRCDPAGKVLGRIGAADPQRDLPTFIVPSPHFDIAVDAHEWLYVANPGARHIETFSFDGTLESFWGQASSRIDGFFGCCNPVHFALLPGGEFVTSEKGVPRIKVYRSTGELHCVVAGPQQLEVGQAELTFTDSQGQGIAFDVATDQTGQVFVLDPRTRTVRVFAQAAALEGAVP